MKTILLWLIVVVLFVHRETAFVLISCLLWEMACLVAGSSSLAHSPLEAYLETMRPWSDEVAMPAES